MGESKKKGPDQPEIIDLRAVYRKVIQRKRLFLIILPIVFVLSSLLIISVPRTYTSSIRLAPEMEQSSIAGGTFSSIASSFGIDLSNIQTSDAISPALYPDLLDDNGFVAGLFDMKVQTADKTLSTTYYDYLKNNQQHAWWEKLSQWIKSLLPRPADNIAAKDNPNRPYDAYNVSKKDNDLMDAIRDKITIDVDKKYGIISISVRDQDPLICKTVADSLMSHLQTFITKYRTNKARLDEVYYRKLMTEARQAYTRTRQAYGRYADANEEVVLASFKAKENDLENEMQLQYNTYSMLNTQWKAAKARIQDATPAFTILKGASVPIKPTGPKRMVFVLGMLLLATFLIIGYIIKDEIFNKASQTE